MPALFLIAAAAAAMASAAPTLPRSDTRGEAQSVLDQQRAAAPRTNGAGGIGAEEAQAVMARYLASIGKLLDDSGAGPQQ